MNNNLINELNNKLDAQDKIINTQALEIARLKKEKYEALEYIKDTHVSITQLEAGTGLLNTKDYLLSILGDKENE